MSQSILYSYTPDQLQKLLDVSNGYSDVLRTLGLNPKGNNPETLKQVIKQYGLDETKLNENRKQFFIENAKSTHLKRRISTEDILHNQYPNFQSSSLLKRLIKEGYKENKCEQCGITEWQNKPIIFHLHHKDGNHQNNNIDNLQVLCPNCHSQTETFAGKNAQKNKDKRKKNKQQIDNIIRKLPPISRGELKELIRKNSFVSIGKMFNVSDNAIRKWCDKYNLPRKTSIIKNITDKDWECI